MKRGPRAFQAATIRAALKTLTDASSPRRFLVADEPGLGKTVVARGVLEELSANREEPLCVFYVCSNQSIARQNLKELAKFLPDAEQKSALATIDRPSLLPVGEPPSCKRVNIYSLTPGTALPGRGGKSGRGRLDERALIYVLLESALGLRVNGMRGLLRSGVDKGNFQTWLDFYRYQIEQSEIRIEDFLPLWRRELAALFSAPDESRLAESIERAVNGESADSSSLLIAKLRGSMACAALSSVKPDIVIFDEFQRFRDLLDDPSDEVESEYDAISGRVLKAVLGDHPTYAPGLLLLSATPYTPYRSRGGISDDSTLNDDFFELISFLSGGGTIGADAAKDARSLFRVLEEELLKGQQLSDRAKEARESLQRFLSRLLSRTERSHAANGDEELLASMRPLDSPLLAEDLLAFEHLARIS